MKRLVVLAAAAFLVAGLVAPVQAATINVSQVVGTIYETASIYDYSTTGANMDGMLVTARYQKYSSGLYGDVYEITNPWVDIDSDSGRVTFLGSDFDLRLDGDSYNNEWSLDFEISSSTYRLLSLAFNGGPGRTVFDRTLPNTGTPGSAQGRDFSNFDSWSGTINVTYFNQVKLDGFAPVGDIYRDVLVAFVGGLGENDNYSFLMDTDNATTDIIEQPVIPEPTSMLLLGSGLIGLAGAVRRRLRK